MLVFTLLAVTLWGLPMWIADVILEKKNYKGSTGFFLGFFLGWVGVLVALMIPFKPKGY